MEKSKTSTLSNALIWFGAAVSIAEILTGTLIAPLGFSKGLAAIIIGHVIGCALLYFTGIIGAQTEKSSMETVKISFGQKGSLLFSTLNVLQLVGWTAVMIVSGAAAASSVYNIGGDWVWSIAIGVLIALWVIIGLKNLGKLNMIAMGGLFILTIILSTVIFKGNATVVLEQGISFGAAVELSVAMPLSWLPLISDYTREAAKPKQATLVSSIAYFLVSCWMYVIGMGAAIFTGESDIAKIMMSAGLGIIAVIIIIFSTVTTTFLDVYSAGVSSESISKKLKEKPVAIAVCAIGTLLAIFTPITQYENFLYLIGSVFAPMIAILITDFFILKKDHTGETVSIINVVIWAIGFVVYRIFMTIDTPLGNTLPVMVIISILCMVANKIFRDK
ncbi:MAG: putative hydroxymethylpyrimidine transporter CytX [Clostridium sp.]|uniref:putative hydroxymethylpyrimidine transporter CytX n=1 Tax=Clostridium sp. TaxID=1506 RepID=UPI002A8A9CD6|nr:putative hydroxymethylpyrimidine transporter CytX [Clostridium sp.]MDY5099452.1 putative hydroxymethylpyrimidine transporter CytX [Clostridium sp.]